MKLLTRRFFCDNSQCRQRIFCERLPSVVGKYARLTIRLSEALTLIGFTLSGEAGGRLTLQLGMRVSPDTLLRLVRKTALQKVPTPRVLEVDDFAFRRGRSYGTILVDLERRGAIDLLPDREQSTLADWLKAHPGIEIITRDRSRAYAEAIAEGAPDAVQIGDRWHILVRRLTRRLIPIKDGKGCKEQTLGSTAYLAAKANGDSSMLYESEKVRKAFTGLSRETRVIW